MFFFPICKSLEKCLFRFLPTFCPSTDELIKKLWYIYILEYYSAIKKNEIMPFAATRMDLETIILIKVGQWNIDIIWYHLYVKSKKKRIQINRLTDFEKFMITKGDRLGWVGGMDCTQSMEWLASGDLMHRTRTLPSILWSSMWKQTVRENGHVHMCDWIPLLYSRSYHSLVSQLYFSKAWEKKGQS